MPLGLFQLHVLIISYNKVFHFFMTCFLVIVFMHSYGSIAKPVQVTEWQFHSLFQSIVIRDVSLCMVYACITDHCMSRSTWCLLCTCIRCSTKSLNLLSPNHTHVQCIQWLWKYGPNLLGCIIRYFQAYRHWVLLSVQMHEVIVVENHF